MKRVQIEISNEATYFSYVCMLSDYERIRANWKNGMETAETKTSANKTIKTFLPFLLEATFFLCVCANVERDSPFAAPPTSATRWKIVNWCER